MSYSSSHCSVHSPACSSAVGLWPYAGKPRKPQKVLGSKEHILNCAKTAQDDASEILVSGRSCTNRSHKPPKPGAVRQHQSSLRVSGKMVSQANVPPKAAGKALLYACLVASASKPWHVGLLAHDPNMCVVTRLGCSSLCVLLLWSRVMDPRQFSSLDYCARG